MTSSSRRRRGEIRRRPQPLGQLVGALCGDPECLLRAVIGVALGLDEPVALEALQGRVHLADVQRPHLAGPLLELLTQLEAIFRSLGEQRQDRVTDAHEPAFRSSITSMLLARLDDVQPIIAGVTPNVVSPPVERSLAWS